MWFASVNRFILNALDWTNEQNFHLIEYQQTLNSVDKIEVLVWFIVLKPPFYSYIDTNIWFVFSLSRLTLAAVGTVYDVHCTYNISYDTRSNTYL